MHTRFSKSIVIQSFYEILLILGEMYIKNLEMTRGRFLDEIVFV